jgi:hypothetical protein
LEQTTITTKTSLFRPFPDPKRILSERSHDLLLPVGVVAYKKFDPRFDHAVLIALPVEPKFDLLGAGRGAYYTESCRENWLGYSLTQDRWDVDCDLRFFERHSSEDVASMERYYQAIHARFAKARAYFKAHGVLQGRLDAPPDGTDCSEALMFLGGPTPCGQNWAAYDEELIWLNEGTDEEDVAIFNKAGYRYQYIGTVSEDPFKGHGDTAHFFYEPQTKSVRMVVDYS